MEQSTPIALETTKENIAALGITCTECRAPARPGQTFFRCQSSDFDDKDLPVACTAYLCGADGCHERHRKHHQKAEGDRKKRIAGR